MMRERAALYIRTLANTGSITQAAQQLYITPSALSKYISSLEKETGNVLFSRIGYHFVLTPAGEKALEWFSRLESISAQMDIEMKDLAHCSNGLIRFGLQTSVSDFMMNEILPEFKEKWPGMDISMYEEANQAIVRRMKCYELDFAISSHLLSDDGIKSIPLIRLEQVLYVHKDNELIKKAVKRKGCKYPWIDLSWCKDTPFIMMHPEQSPRLDMERNLAPIMGNIRISLETRTMRSMFEGADHDMGIVAACEGMDRFYSNQWKNIRKLSYGEDLDPTVFYMFFYEKMHRSDAASDLMELIRTRFAGVQRQAE